MLMLMRIRMVGILVFLASTSLLVACGGGGGGGMDRQEPPMTRTPLDNEEPPETDEPPEIEVPLDNEEPPETDEPPEIEVPLDNEEPPETDEPPEIEVPPTTTTDWPDWPVDPVNARSLVGGSALAYTPEQIRGYFVSVRDIVRNADSRAYTPSESDPEDTYSAAGNCVEFPASCEFGDSETEYQSVMTHRGVPIVQGRVSNAIRNGTSRMENSVGYAGLLEYGYFFVGHDERRLGMEETFRASTSWANGESLCCEPENVPIATGRWEGAMIGKDKSVGTTHGHVVQGDADVVVTLIAGSGSSDPYSDRNVDVRFSNIYDLNNGNRHPDITGDFPMGTATASFGSNSVDVTHINGHFAGPRNENVVGTFQTGNLIGAFGGNKVE